MIDNWVDFSLSVAGGATAFLCLFEGTRRLGAYGVHRKAVLMTVSAAAIGVLYGGVAFWVYAGLRATRGGVQRKNAPAPGAAARGGGRSPEGEENGDPPRASGEPDEQSGGTRSSA